MIYTIGEVATKLGLSAHTIRFYEKEGLLPFVLRNESGHRAFTEADIGLFQIICCLKDGGMPIKKIKIYIDMCMKGSESIQGIIDMLTAHKESVIAEINNLSEKLEVIEQKIERYSKPDAVAVLNEQLREMDEEKQKYNLK